jgi:glycosyltransferase involved in cell wall biosynthesis
VIEQRPNRGKGAAVRAGMLASTGDTVVFMDADLATDLDGLDPLLAALDDADVAVGSRAVPGSVVYRGTRSRAAIALACRVLVRTLTKVRVRDTQCGFKAFRGPAGRLLFSMAECDGFSFDVEVLDLARILGLRAVEVPVTWTAVEGSSVRLLRDPARMTVDLFRIALRLRGEPTRARARALGWGCDQAGLSSWVTDD